MEFDITKRYLDKYIIGDSLEISSKHYKSVPVTIFVEMGGETIRVDAQFGGYIVNE